MVSLQCVILSESSNFPIGKRLCYIQGTEKLMFFQLVGYFLIISISFEGEKILKKNLHCTCWAFHQNEPSYGSTTCTEH